VLLSGLRDRVEDGLTAVVTVTDNGGASGRLRQELGIAPPGDVRNCLVALAGRRQLAQSLTTASRPAPSCAITPPAISSSLRSPTCPAASAKASSRPPGSADQGRRAARRQ
jgi:hypothetical protein